VELEEPQEWYQSRLRPHESVRKGSDFTFEDDRLEWSFTIWNGDDASCCPTGGRVSGTFTIRKTEREAPATHERVAGWRMAVQDGKRGPIDE
jgi:hypothetical protein